MRKKYKSKKKVSMYKTTLRGLKKKKQDKQKEEEGTLYKAGAF